MQRAHCCQLLLDTRTATVQQFDSKRDGFGLMRRMKLSSKMSVDANQRPLRAVQNRKEADRHAGPPIYGVDP